MACSLSTTKKASSYELEALSGERAIGPGISIVIGTDYAQCTPCAGDSQAPYEELKQLIRTNHAHLHVS